MRYADIKYPDTYDGLGIRIALYVQGCSRHCKGCHNTKTWDFDGGQEFTEKTRDYILDILKLDWVHGLSVLGGEPLEQDDTLTALLRDVRDMFPHKNIWLWTGFTYEDVQDREILKYVDMIVDGAFEEDKKDLRLDFRGSSNQRIINLREKRNDEGH